MVIILIFFLMINVVILCGCIEEKKEIDTLDIHISNGTNRTYNAILLLNNTKGIEIFNKSFSIDPDEQLDYKDITDKIGNYVLTIKLEDFRTSSFIRCICPRPSAFTSQPNSKYSLIFSSDRIPKQSITAMGFPAQVTISLGSRLRYCKCGTAKIIASTPLSTFGKSLCTDKFISSS